MRYPHLFSRLYNTPLLLAPDKAMAIEEVFRAWMSGNGAPPTPETVAAFEAGQRRTSLEAATGPLTRYADKPYQMTDSGIAVIPVFGTLVQRASGMDAMSGLMSYARIDKLFSAAQADADVRAILLEYDTAGGDAPGLFSLADRLLSTRGGKPVWAFVNEMALSAGYALASTADRIYAPATGLVGSIGAVTMHVDQSQRDAKAGLVYTMIQSGERKTDGHSHAPISKTALANAQAQIHRLRTMFSEHVDAARGLKPGTAYATEAAVFNAEQGLAAGLIDGIASFRETIAKLEAEIAPATPAFPTAGLNGAALSTARQAATTGVNPMTQQQALAATPAEVAPALAVAMKTEGAQAERARIATILQSEAAVGRAKMAQTFALETDIDAATAIKLLGASPVEAPAAPAAASPAADAAAKLGAPANLLAAAMSAVPNPKVGAADAGEADDSEAAQVARLTAQILKAGKPAAI